MENRVPKFLRREDVSPAILFIIVFSTALRDSGENLKVSVP